jgi:DNA-binding FadR family transcriptional regulator
MATIGLESAPNSRALDALSPLRLPQLYEQIAERLREQILSGGIECGSRLPSERDLARQLEVSRSSVREAVAVLQVEGLLETRRGAGSFVAEDARAILLGRAEAGLGTAAQDADVSPSTLLEARAVFEPAIARLASSRAQRDPIAEELLRQMERLAQHDEDGAGSATTRAQWNEADRLFHRQLAGMTGNGILVAIAGQVAETMNEKLWQRLRDESIGVPGRMGLHAAEHRLIYEAVLEGDAQSAEFYAAQHIQRVKRYMSLD